MNAAEKIAHAAERKAFEAMLDSLIRKSQTKDVCTVANDFVNMVQKIHSSVWTPETFEMLHQIANDPDSKWAHYAERLLRECDPYLLRTFLTAAAYEGGFRGFQRARANSEKYDCNIPWIVLMDPTSACNMRCAGCWAAEYGHKQNLTFEEMDRVLTEGAELGTHACLFTGGEPLMRKADIFRLCEKHRDIAFHAFTNGTLIDQAFCDELKRVGNFIVSVSIEGFEDANDGRRGAGHFEKALAAMDLMHKNHIPFGVSICYTSKNYKVVTSDEFLDLLISKGCFFAWYFHYMPVGMGATTDLLLNPEQRAYMKDRVREIRGLTGGKEIFAIDFQNDGEFTSPAASSTAISTPRATLSPACSSITRVRTSAKRASSNVSSSRFLRSTARASRSTTTTCAPARCWKIPNICHRWSRAAARIRPTWKRPRAWSTCATSASPTPPAGAPRPKSSGTRSTTTDRSRPYRKTAPARFRGSALFLSNGLTEFRAAHGTK